MNERGFTEKELHFAIICLYVNIYFWFEIRGGQVQNEQRKSYCFFFKAKAVYKKVHNNVYKCVCVFKCI